MILTLAKRERYYQRFRLVYALMLTILGLYTLLGAICFCALEAPNEHAMMARREEEARAIRLSGRKKLQNEIQKNIRRAGANRAPKDRFEEALDAYEQSILESFLLLHHRSKKAQDQQNAPSLLWQTTPKWTLWGGLYYVLTTYTTIGFGDLVAETPAGRLLTVVYALVGIPLVLVVLNVWGGGLFRLTANIWQVLVRCCCGADNSESPTSTSSSNEHRRLLESSNKTTNATLRSADEWPKRAADVPLKFTFFLLVFWLLFSAAVFAFFLHWNYFDAAYFFFVSLTTIGYGEYTIEHSVACAYFILVLTGLSVVSMSVNAIQARIEFVYNILAGSIEDDFKRTLLASSTTKQHETGVDPSSPPNLSLLSPKHHDAVGISSPRPTPKSSPQHSPASSRRHIGVVLEDDESEDKDAVRRFSRDMGIGNRILGRMINEHL